jgi:hypothetical protein
VSTCSKQDKAKADYISSGVSTCVYYFTCRKCTRSSYSAVLSDIIGPLLVHITGGVEQWWSGQCFLRGPLTFSAKVACDPCGGLCVADVFANVVSAAHTTTLQARVSIVELMRDMCLRFGIRVCMCLSVKWPYSLLLIVLLQSEYRLHSSGGLQGGARK